MTLIGRKEARLGGRGRRERKTRETRMRSSHRSSAVGGSTTPSINSRDWCLSRPKGRQGSGREKKTPIKEILSSTEF